MKFKDRLYSLFYQKKFLDKYLFALFFTALNKKNFIFKYLKETIFNKEKRAKLNEYN